MKSRSADEVASMPSMDVGPNVVTLCSIQLSILVREREATIMTLHAPGRRSGERARTRSKRNSKELMTTALKSHCRDLECQDLATREHCLSEEVSSFRASITPWTTCKGETHISKRRGRGKTPRHIHTQ